MDEIYAQILEYLSKENIPIVHFNYNNQYNDLLDNNFAELIIKVKTKDLPKWIYFYSMINDNNNPKIVKMNYKKGILKSLIKFEFKNVTSNNEKDLVSRNLHIFLDALQKKYYTVCPTKQRIHILVKPTYRCNLDCKYCFDKPHRERTKKDMPMVVLDRVLHVASQTVSSLYLTFHGGEPTIVGTQWYERAFIEVISKYPMLNFKFDFVSNGTRMDDEWFELFKKYNITYCVSYNANHQANLRCASQLNIDEQRDIELGEKVEKVIREHDIGIVDVVTGQNYKDMIKTYEFYKNIQGKHTVAMNVVNQNKQTEKNNLNMTPEEYSAEFLKYFRYWLFDKDGINERSCANMLDLVMGNIKSVTCEYRDCRGERYTINPLGEIYECDKYLPERYKAGTVFEIENFDEIYKTNGYKLYSSEIDERFNNICSKCDYFFVCHGGCHASVIESAGDGRGIDKFACESLKLKFNGVYDILRDVDTVSYKNINGHAAYMMNKYGFFSVKDIKQMLKEINFPLSLEYDPENLFKCSEYKIFSVINYGSLYTDIGQTLRILKRDGVNSYEEPYVLFKQLVDGLLITNDL